MLFSVFNPVTEQPKNIFEGLLKLIFVLIQSKAAWAIVIGCICLFAALDIMLKHERPFKQSSQRHNPTKDHDHTV